MSQFNLNRPSISNLDTYQHFNADPRQISPAHSGQTIDFDFPPQSNQITGQNMYSNVLDDYGSRYTSTYENITPGQMTYYVDKTICGPFFPPNYTYNADIISHYYVDPMGTLKTHFERIPTTDTLACLSWLKDSGEFREDLMSRQMSVDNQSRFESQLFR